MLTVENSWALLDGAQAPKEVVMKRVRCLSKFWIEGHMVREGEEGDVPDALANELITSNKAALVAEEVEEENHGTIAEAATGKGREDVQVLHRGGVGSDNGESR